MRRRTRKAQNDFRVMPFHSLFDTKRKGSARRMPDCETNGRSHGRARSDVSVLGRMCLREEEMRGAGSEKADEPRVVVERLQCRDDEAAPRERAAERGSSDRAHVPAA